MGISGLLPALKSIQKTRHLSEYKGKTIAVDAYVWLHKGVYACATEIATGKATRKCVFYFCVTPSACHSLHPWRQIRGLCDASRALATTLQHHSIPRL